MEPDIYVFVADSLRADTATSDLLPFCNSVADVRFDRAYAPGTWTLPVHATLYSGECPTKHEITRRGDTVGPKETKIPEKARDNGYETALFSENPTFSRKTGFDAGIDQVNDGIDQKPYRSTFSPTTAIDEISPSAAIQLMVAVAKGSNTYRDLFNTFYAAFNRIRDIDSSSYPHHGDRVLNHLSDYIVSMDTPKLCFTNLLDTHNPHHAPPEIGAELLNVHISKKERELLSLANDNREYLLGDGELPEKTERMFGDWETVFQRRYENYRCQARYVDKLLENWAEENPHLWEESLVVVIGDHGQMFGEENMVGHQTSLHPAGIQIPMFINYPKSWPEAADTPAVVEKPVSLRGLSHGIQGVVDQSIDTREDFVQKVVDTRDIDQNIVSVVDGPTWSVDPLREEEKFYNQKIDQVAVRKVGIIAQEYMTVYQSQWDSNEIQSTTYELSNYDRTENPELEAHEIPESYKMWLQRSPDNEISTEVNSRLKQLGYR
ncbi:sulfatase-like hydrolase/transferase [Halomicrococcus sp. NG-SE-24]|uniref:sulfatase-like hydrolase/transferase n=1 Tax=Halomicrococcus sp. NG-SE-24 TaxID=3436928 RepID=UPI003D9901C3